MRATLFLSLLAIATVSNAQDPVKVGPKIYKQTFENDRVRVFEVTFKPHASIGMHKHPDHVVYVIKGGKLEIAESGKKPAIFDLKPGMTVFIPAQSHSARNLGGGTVKLVVTELKG